MAWSGALAAALRRTRADLRGVSAVGLCGQTPTLVPVDAVGVPVRPALTWQDTRATAEAAALEARFGDPEPLIGTALPWSAANMPAKLLWLARHEPATLSRTRWLLQAETGFDRPTRPDHVPALEGETNESYGYATPGRLFAPGYIAGLRDAAYGRPPARYSRRVAPGVLR